MARYGNKEKQTREGGRGRVEKERERESAPEEVLQPSSNGGRPCEGNLTVVRGCNAQPCHVEVTWICKIKRIAAKGSRS